MFASAFIISLEVVINKITDQFYNISTIEKNLPDLSFLVCCTLDSTFASLFSSNFTLLLGEKTRKSVFIKALELFLYRLSISHSKLFYHLD